MLLSLLLACKDAPSPAKDSDPVVQTDDSSVEDDSDDTGLPCPDVGTDPLRIDDCWEVVAPPALAEQARLLATGGLLVGCEDELPPLGVAELEGDRPAIVLAVDPTIAPEAYSVRVESRRIRITGADTAGLAWGMIDWLRSLDAVELSGGAAWRPDPTSTLNGGPTTCSNYDELCEASESCQVGGAWTPVEQVLWHPQDVVNHPAVPVRVAFASFKGSQNATFLPTIWHAGLGRCEDPADTAPFWEAALRCDAQAPPDEVGYDPCDELRLRLDTLLLGRFSHALDDGYNFRYGASLEIATGCSATQLYEDAKNYLAIRGVELVPTVYGLETRAPETPVAGDYIFVEEPAELWGKTGDATLSEGLALGGTFTVCDGDGLLALDCDALDADGRVSEPTLLSPTYDTDTTPVGSRISRCGQFELCQVRENCWNTVEDRYGLALQPADEASCSNPALRMPLQDDGRSYVLRFRGSVIESADLSVKLVIQLTDGRSYASEFAVLSTLASEADYLAPESPLDPSLGDWVLYSFVFRTPEPDARISSVYAQILGVPGSLAMIDDIDLAAIDGQLREVDADSVRGLDCVTVDDPAQSPLAVEPWYDPEGQVSGRLARLRADCLSPGDTVDLLYRSFTHYGLWPGFSARQSAYTYSIDVTNPRYWQAEDSPIEQLRSYGPLGDLLLLSDLGGEARGLARAQGIDGLSAAEVLSTYACVAQAELCTDCGDCDEITTSPGADQACSCPDWDSDTRLLVAGDMFTWLHNGGDSELGVPGKEDYQLPYGGPSGGTWPARRLMPSNTIYLSWFHFDSRKDGEPVGGHEMVRGFVEDFSADGLATIPVSAWDPDAQRAWAAMAAGDVGEIYGVGHYGWGTDTQAARVMRQAGAVFWDPGWRERASWSQSDDARLPGGDQRAALTLDGLSFEDSASLEWPIAGRWLRIDAANAAWSAPALSVEADRVLVRVYATPTEGCRFTGRFDFGDSAAEVERVPEVIDEHRVYSFAADRPEGATELRFSLLATDCVGGVIDDLTIYESLPSSAFPYPLSLEHLDVWDATETADARNRICGDPLVWDCVNLNTWE